VKLPLTWPNSSNSRSVSVRPAQFTATNGAWRRIDWLWMNRATTSLPTPLSPVIRTLPGLCAARRRKLAQYSQSEGSRRSPRTTSARCYLSALKMLDEASVQACDARSGTIHRRSDVSGPKDALDRAISSHSDAACPGAVTGSN